MTAKQMLVSTFSSHLIIIEKSPSVNITEINIVPFSEAFPFLYFQISGRILRSNSWTIYFNNFIGKLVRFLRSSFDSYKLFKKFKYNFRLAVTKLRRTGISMVLFYFVSLDKREFTQFARALANRTNLEKCFATAWRMSLGFRYEGENEKLVQFLQEYCSNNEWDFDAWLKLQSKKVVNLFQHKERTADQ